MILAVMIDDNEKQSQNYNADYDVGEEDDVVLDLVVRAGEEAAGGVACVGAHHLSSRHHDHQRDHQHDHSHDHQHDHSHDHQYDAHHL